MPRVITLFEDDRVPQLYPLTWLRHAGDLICGGRSLAVRIAARYHPEQRFALWCRNALASLLRESDPGLEVNRVYDRFLMLNARLLAPPELAAMIPVEGADRAYVCGGSLVGLRLSADKARALRFDGPFNLESIPDGVPVETLPVKLIEYPWDLIRESPALLAEDCEPDAAAGLPQGAADPGAHLLAPERITLDPSARVMPGAVLDAEKGPIRIGPSVRVMPHAYLEGPLCIESDSVIKAGAKVYSGTYIGPVCKVGGEVEASILHACANKQHEGFLGHSYVAEWVNLGAATNTSDLKNNYSPVRARTGREELETGCTFLGSIIGDHSKTAIGTLLSTGSVIGVGCNLFGAGFPPRFIPSFLWGGAQGLAEYALDKFLSTAQRVKARRGRNLSAAEAALLAHVFEATRPERAAFRPEV